MRHFVGTAISRPNGREATVYNCDRRSHTIIVGTQFIASVGAGFQPARFYLRPHVVAPPASRRDAKLCSKTNNLISFLRISERCDPRRMVASLRDAEKRFGDTVCYKALHPLRDAIIATFGRNYKRTLRVRSDGQCPSLRRDGDW